MFWIIVKKLGSLWFAILLLVVIILASIVGTICETSFSADVAQKYVYNAPWFNFWLSALCVNLFCAALIRCRPPKRHLIGFYITHAGIITLLIGSMIDRVWGIEGFVHLYSTHPGSNVMELHEQLLRVKADGQTATTEFKVTTLGGDAPVQSPLQDVKIQIEDVQPVTSDEVADPVAAGTPGARPALNLTLQGPMMGRHDKTMFLGDDTDFGMKGLTTLLFLPGKPPEKNAGAEDTSAGDGASLELQFEGKRFNFPVRQHDQTEHELEGVPGWKLRMVGYFPNFRMQDGKPVTIDNEPNNPAVCFELIGPEVKGVKVEDPHAEQGIDQEVGVLKPRREVFFVFMKQNQVMARAAHGEPTKGQAKLTVARTPHESPIETPNGLAVYLDEDGKLRYLLKSRKGGESTGTLELEKPLLVGWAPGAQFVAHELVPSAKRKLVFTPHPEMKSKDMESVNLGMKVYAGPALPERELLPNYKIAKYILIGLLALCAVLYMGWFVIGQSGLEWRVLIGLLGLCILALPLYYITSSGSYLEPRVLPEENMLWVGQTTVENAARVPQEITVGGKKINFEFVNKTVVLPFTVTLKKFNAPLTEGTNDFAAFESILSFDNRKDTVWLKSDSPSAKQLGSTVVTGAIVGADDGKLLMTGAFGNEIEIDSADIERTDVQTQKISMNRPTIFPITTLAPYLGTSYKFSQASHHMPADPTYSGVQVLRDPGWLLKWVGCLLICSGIFTMFYVIPYFRQPKRAAVPVQPVVAENTAGSKKKKLRPASN